ncbi:MAG: PSD1 and planctomycete cytochrome C domain-containing protein [Chthoniobacteraceae bacterium]
MTIFLRAFFLGLLFASGMARVVAAEATFLRALNLNGPALTIDGRAWDGKNSRDLSFKGSAFENQKVSLRPPTDPARAEMLRSSIWNAGKPDTKPRVDVELSGIPAGVFQVFLYVWEDNHSEQFDVLVNDRPVLEDFHSGSTGTWKKLGPWKCESVDGKIKLSARGGAANLSGIEVWKGDGAISDGARAEFVSAPTAEQIAFFESRIRPVLVERCYECHSAKADKIKGGLLLDSRAGIAKGGDTGPAVTPGDLDASLLIEAVRYQDKDFAMPPKKKLPPEQIAALEEWVKMGAPDPRTADTVAAVKAKTAIDWPKAREWWSLRALAAPQPPAVKATAWPANDLDRFILARIEQAGLRAAPDAEKRTLIRRATYDLTGLPPTPEEVDAFVADDSSGAFAKVVDRLLASPRYGERWGRHWLDVVRYADTAGDNSDYPIPQMHRYRDWVIAAFNRDQPYDEFVRDQLAGDLRSGATDEERNGRIVATGYLANARRFGSRVDDYPQHLTIEDTIDSVGRTFLGLTVNCARCHDHKFDPITTEDYYALYGIFHSTRYPWPGIELDKKQRDFVPLVPASKLPEADAARKEREKEQARLDKEATRLKDALKTTPAAEKKSAEARLKAAERAAKDFASTPLPFELAYAVADSMKIADVPVQQKGDPARPGAIVPRRFLTVLGGAQLSRDADSSGRAQLADWILAKDNPLPARVMINRIWLHHFGRGIVATPNDFGRQGKPPTHPGLLDYLAANFRAGGWSVKAMHRLIMLSHTYRLASTREAGALAHDPGNELLASFPRRRLDAEAIRDTLLALGGNLDLSPAGTHPFPPQREWNFTQHNAFKAVYETDHRSVYLMTQRIQRHPFLAIFDGADPSASTPARPTSTTPLQALYLLNDVLVHEQSRRVAESITKSSGDDALRVQRAYSLLFARPAADGEVTAARSFLADARAKLRDAGTAAEQLDSEAWRAYLRVLFRLNEFVYLD